MHSILRTLCSNFSIYVVLHNTLVLAYSYRFTPVFCILDMVSCENILVQKTDNIWRINDLGSIR